MVDMPTVNKQKVFITRSAWSVLAGSDRRLVQVAQVPAQVLEVAGSSQVAMELDPGRDLMDHRVSSEESPVDQLFDCSNCLSCVLLRSLNDH